MHERMPYGTGEEWGTFGMGRVLATRSKCHVLRATIWKEDLRSHRTVVDWAARGVSEWHSRQWRVPGRWTRQERHSLIYHKVTKREPTSFTSTILNLILKLPGLWALVLSAYEFLLPYLCFSFSIFLGLDIWIIAIPRIDWLCWECGLGWFSGACSSFASFDWKCSMNAFCTITVNHTLSGCLFRGIHFTTTRLQILSALLFEFRVAIFFLHFVSFSLIAFFTVVSFVFSSFYFLLSILHYWEGICLFTTLLHLLRCMCGHLFSRLCD